MPINVNFGVRAHALDARKPLLRKGLLAWALGVGRIWLANYTAGVYGGRTNYTIRVYGLRP